MIAPTPQPRDTTSRLVASLAAYTPWAVLAVALLVFLGQVYRHSRLRLDDAYITYRYAQHLAAGQGLVWNVGGEPTEGFTSLLHVLLLSAGIRLGAHPDALSLVLSIACVLATCALLLYGLRRQTGRLALFAVLAVALYLADRVTAIHSTTGLETQVFVLALCLSYLAALAFVDRPTGSRAVLLAAFVFASVLGRPEAVVYGAGTYLALGLFGLQRARAGHRAVLKQVALSAAVLLLLGGVYAAWKLWYFGYLLPNPFYVKSDQVSLAGLRDVLAYVRHVLLWYGALALLGGVLAVRAGLLAWLRRPAVLAKCLLTLLPPLLALGYYVTITHEVGGSFRFSYPTNIYLVFAVAALVSQPLLTPTRRARWAPALIAACAVYMLLPIISQSTWRVSQLPLDPFNQYHWRVATALRETGLESQAIIITDAAGIIPFVSGFNQIDRVGLNDNYFSGRYGSTMAEREARLWSLPADVYLGYEPPAAAGSRRAGDDPVMQSPYVTHVLLSPDRFVGIGDRVHLQDTALLYGRLCALRDGWDWLGELHWAGDDAWGLKAFLYVRKGSPHTAILKQALTHIIDTPAGSVALDTR